MEAKILNIKGLNTRSNNIAQDESALIDCLNVYKDTNGNIRQTRAFEEKPVNFSVCWGWVASDGYYIKKTGKLLVFCQEGVFSVQLNALGNLTATQITTDFKYTSKLSFAEFGDTVYIADPSGANELCKFDGRYYYRAGVPQSKFTLSTSVGTSLYVRGFLKHIDQNGNELYGDYLQVDSNATIGTLTASFPSLFYATSPIKYGYLAGFNEYRDTIEITGNTLTIAFTSTNFSIGDNVYIQCSRKGAYVGGGRVDDRVKFTVANVAGNSVTFSFDYGNGLGFSFENAISTIWFETAASVQSTYGYQMYATLSRNFGLSPVDVNSTSFAQSGSQIDIEDVYDTTVVKGLPKKFKYISAFNNQMVGVYDKNKVAWSDLGVGSSVETFAPFDYETIGKSDEGDVTGVFCSTDHIVVFKKEDIFFLFGQLYGRQYRIVKSTTTGIGCVSHSSIAPYSGGCVFLSEKGLYFTANGGLPEELSDIVEPTITSYSAKDRAYIYFDYSSERMFICFQDGNMELDYYWKDWFKSDVEEQAVWSAWTPYGRHFIRNELSLTIRKESTIEKPSSCYIQTAWQSNQTPELDKKFVSVSAINGYNDSFKVKFDTYYNWSSTSDGNTSREISSIPIAKASCPAKTAKAASFKISKDGVNEDFVISGIFYEVEQRQERAKDR